MRRHTEAARTLRARGAAARGMLLAGGILAALTWSAAAWAGGEIYGTIRTRDGKSFTGPIRWDKNENFWDDVLDAAKEGHVEGRRSRQEVRIFGLQISRIGDRIQVRSELSVPFGHVSAIQSEGRERVRLELRNGEVIEARTSSDIGGGMRGIAIADETEGTVELEWSSVERIEFRGNPGPGRDAERLYGTVETRRARFTGFIVWDRDEALTGDILDGEEDGRKYKVPFAKIAAIERGGDEVSLVRLDGGRTVELTGTNDVNDENRGITITVPGTGSIEVSWDEFRRVEFFPAPASATWDSFSGGRRIRGVVRATDGRSFTGDITWDRDETWSWEPLDGKTAGVDFSVLFENIASIRRTSSGGALVRLVDGSEYELSDSNDVDEDNKGIVIRTEGGDEIELNWDAFESLTITPAG